MRHLSLFQLQKHKGEKGHCLQGRVDVPGTGTEALGSHRQKGVTLRPSRTTQRAESQSRLHVEILPQERRNGRALSASKHEASCPQSPLDHFSLISVARLCHPKPITVTIPVLHSESTSYRLVTLPLPGGVLASREWWGGCRKGNWGSIMTLAERALGRAYFLAHTRTSDPQLPPLPGSIRSLCTLYFVYFIIIVWMSEKYPTQAGLM